MSVNELPHIGLPEMKTVVYWANTPYVLTESLNGVVPFTISYSIVTETQECGELLLNLAVELPLNVLDSLL